jgi:aromatic ring-opening dioxygenase LigB subunit
LEYKEYISDLNLDSNIANSLLRHLKEKNHSIEGITTFSATEPIPLRWGEVVPAWFLRDIQTKYVILTQPSRRINKAIDMIPELQALGSDIVSYLHTLAEKVFVLISGDMAHTYQTDGPGPYGIHPSAQPFDDAVEQWAKSLNRNFLLKEAGSMLNTALACGFTGFVFLDSLMSSLKKNIKSQVFCNLHPTYYGMMVAKFDIIS